MSDDAAPILAPPIFEVLEPTAKMTKLALRRADPCGQQRIRGLAQPRAKLVGEDARELIPRRLAQGEAQLL